MTVKESYAILGVKEGADLTAVKQAYRRLAFELHPDLHPEVRDAARRFQRLNEAYVLLTQHLESVRQSAKNGKAGPEATEKARQEAQRAYARAKAGEKPSERTVYKEEVLKDILQDPFARRVFEDIYRHVRKEEGSKPSSTARQGAKAPPRPEAAKQAPSFVKDQAKQTVRQAGSMKKPAAAAAPGVVGKVKGWLRKQIDDEQELKLPGASLKPGAVVRLEIQHGITGKAQTVELVLPPGFQPGKTLRLKGMGRRLGNLAGDLYVRITAI